mmetsp:Transcript_30019/g.80627  ORF Transcript_30019/g.80627 Transcript_30019/m.80627 type:complete len:241 (+) Transcript_30019:68-790(+)
MGRTTRNGSRVDKRWALAGAPRPPAARARRPRTLPPRASCPDRTVAPPRPVAQGGRGMPPSISLLGVARPRPSRLLLTALTVTGHVVLRSQPSRKPIIKQRSILLVLGDRALADEWHGEFARPRGVPARAKHVHTRPAGDTPGWLVVGGIDDPVLMILLGMPTRIVIARMVMDEGGVVFLPLPPYHVRVLPGAAREANPVPGNTCGEALRELALLPRLQARQCAAMARALLVGICPSSRI